MSSRRHVLSFIIVFSLPVLLFHFQNCAPAGKITANADAGTVRLIDDYNKAQVQFVTPESEIHDEAQAVGISGMCNRDHNGARMNWAVSAGGTVDRAVAKGKATCAGGQFVVDLEDLDQYPCGVDHHLVVETDWGASASTRFSRRCQALASQPIPVPDGSPYGTSCAIEYSPASEAEQRCVQICFRANQVVYNRALEVSQCSSLAAGLAGP